MTGDLLFFVRTYAAGTWPPVWRIANHGIEAFRPGDFLYGANVAALDANSFIKAVQLNVAASPLRHSSLELYSHNEDRWMQISQNQRNKSVPAAQLDNIFFFSNRRETGQQNRIHGNAIAAAALNKLQISSKQGIEALVVFWTIEGRVYDEGIFCCAASQTMAPGKSRHHILPKERANILLA